MSDLAPLDDYGNSRYWVARGCRSPALSYLNPDGYPSTWRINKGVGTGFCEGKMSSHNLSSLGHAQGRKAIIIAGMKNTIELYLLNLGDAALLKFPTTSARTAGVPSDVLYGLYLLDRWIC